MNMPHVIAVVDDNESVRQAIGGFVRSCGYFAYTFPSAEAFLHSLYFDVTECLITDLDMPAMSGVELIHQVRDKDARIPVILISASHDEPDVRQAELAGWCRVLPKPFDGSCLLESIVRALGPRSGNAWPLRAS
ncbi:response regulator transcription factor [Burkholderia guangdongensis]|uniref:response regulator transcription factor n=1 Tax=Burkholderia guangdongensis TaxID=1792500 RepID=UPI0015C72930|nr:response regulator [Burkholderia guangdongensis]